jgi:hypothetical protein
MDPKVVNLFNEALGKVVFINDAYRLLGGNKPGSYESQVVGEVVDRMTKTTYLNKMVIVLAGYDDNMD